MANKSRLRIFTGSANPALADAICEHLGCNVGAMSLRRFSDGESHVQINENVRGMDVFVVQPTSTPVHRHLMTGRCEQRRLGLPGSCCLFIRDSLQFKQLADAHPNRR